MLLVSELPNEPKEEFSYQELLSILIPDKSKRESFFKKCQYVFLVEVKPEIVLRYSASFIQKRQHFSLFAFLLQLEKNFNQKRQELAQDFSNYAEILTSEQLQTLYTGVSETEVLSFLKTFFVFEVDTEVVYMQLLLKFRQQLSNKNTFNKFLSVLKSSPLTDTFEFHLECYSLQDRDEWLLADVRLLWLFGLRYLTEHPKTYEQLTRNFSAWYQQVLDEQKGYL